MQIPTSDEQIMECAMDKAHFCLVTGIAPSEYDLLTEAEVEAFIKTWNRLNKQK